MMGEVQIMFWTSQEDKIRYQKASELIPTADRKPANLSVFLRAAANKMADELLGVSDGADHKA